MKKFILAIAIIAIIAAAIAVLRQDKNKRETEVPNLKLSINSWVGFAPFYLAQEKGFFEEGGLKVDISVLEGTAERKAAVLAKRIDVLGDTVDLLVLARGEGVPSVALFEVDISNGADGVVAVNSIQSIQDLRGKTVAAQKNFVGESFLLYLLKKNGMSVNDVTVIDTESGAAGAAFVAGKVDAAVTWEPWLSKATEREDGHVLVTSADEPGVIVDILTAHEDVLKERPEDVKKLIRAWFKAIAYWQNNQAAANAIMAKYYDMPPEEFAEIISGVKWPGYEENLAYFGTAANPGKIYEVANIFSDVFLETGSISKKPDMTKAINNSLLETLYSSP